MRNKSLYYIDNSNKMFWHRIDMLYYYVCVTFVHECVPKMYSISILGLQEVVLNLILVSYYLVVNTYYI